MTKRNAGQHEYVSMCIQCQRVTLPPVRWTLSLVSGWGHPYEKSRKFQRRYDTNNCTTIHGVTLHTITTIIIIFSSSLAYLTVGECSMSGPSILGGSPRVSCVRLPFLKMRRAKHIQYAPRTPPSRKRNVFDGQLRWAVQWWADSPPKLILDSVKQCHLKSISNLYIIILLHHSLVQYNWENIHFRKNIYQKKS